MFGTSKIQKARRVALDPNLLATLDLREGDTVTVDLDVESATILIRKDVAPAETKAGGGRQGA